MALHLPATLAPALANSAWYSMVLIASSPAESAFALIGIFDPRIQCRVQHVHGEVDDHHDDGNVHHQVLHDRIVAPADSFDEKPRHARDIEDGLGDDEAAHQEGGLDADHGDDRQNRILERMVVVDDVLGCSFGTGGPDIVL